MPADPLPRHLNAIKVARRMVTAHEVGFAYDWTPGPTYGQRRETTWAEKRAIVAAKLPEARKTVRRNLRGLRAEAICQTDPACRDLVAQIDAEAAYLTDAQGHKLETLKAKLRQMVSDILDFEDQEAAA